MVSKVSTGKQGERSRNKEGQNPPHFGFVPELLDYMSFVGLLIVWFAGLLVGSVVCS